MLKKMPKRYRQQGLTLLELSIALFIAGIIVFAAIEIFFSARGVYDEQMNRARQQDNLRFAHFFPSYTAKLAGYQLPPEQDRYTHFSGAVVQGEDEVETTTVISDGRVSASIANPLVGSDILAVSYQGHNDFLVQNCLSQEVLEGQYAMDVFYVNAAGSLVCKPNRSPAALAGQSNVQNAQPVTTGVIGFEVLYGEDTDNDGSVNRYVPYPDVTSKTDILALRMALCVVAESDDPATDAVEYCGEVTQQPNRWLIQTVALRSLVP